MSHAAKYLSDPTPFQHLLTYNFGAIAGWGAANEFITPTPAEHHRSFDNRTNQDDYT